jgi:hypothetical protein
VARTKLNLLELKGKAAARLQGALRALQAAPSRATRAAFAEAWEEGAAKGLPIKQLLEAQARLRSLERSAAFAAEAKLEWLAAEAQASMAPLDMSEAATEAEAAAVGKLDETNRALVDARAALAAAREKQAALDDAATEAVLLAAPRPVDDHAGADLALGRCRQLGVERGVGRRVAEVKLLEPSALTLSGVVQTNVAAAAVAQADLAKYRDEASDTAFASQEAVTEQQRRASYLEQQIAAAAAAAAAVEAAEAATRLAEAIAKATYTRLHDKQSVSFHHRDAVAAALKAADDGWQESLDRRAKLCDAEEMVREAVDALTRSDHAAAVAARAASRASQLLRWVRQEETMLRQQCGLQEERWREFERKRLEAGGEAAGEAAGGEAMAAVAKVSAEEPPDGSEPEACCGCFGGGGARGGDGARGEAGGGGEGGTEMAMVGGSSVVVMPKRSAVPPPPHLDTGQGGNPLFELVDCFAWLPLRHAARRAELLEALTASGGFDNADVCNLVAREMCELDAASASRLVDRLTRRLQTVQGLPVVQTRPGRGAGAGAARWRRSIGLVVSVQRATQGMGAVLATPPVLKVQHSHRTPIPDAVVGAVAECWIAQLAATTVDRRELLRYTRLVAGIDGADFTRTLRALLAYHHEAAATATEASLEAVYLAVEAICEHSRRSSPPSATSPLEARLIDAWYAPGTSNAAGGGTVEGGPTPPRASPAHVALEATALHFCKVLSGAQTDYAARAAAGAPPPACAARRPTTRRSSASSSRWSRSSSAGSTTP